MATVYDVQATKLIELVKEDLKKINAFRQPEWALFVKTGSHKERQPIQDDWWFARGASILRRLYVDGPKGVSRLRSYYGGRKARGVKPHRFAKGAGKILRVWLQLLEKEGYLARDKKGRKISAKGMKFIDGKAFELSKAMKIERPAAEAQATAMIEQKPLQAEAKAPAAVTAGAELK